MPTTTPTDWQAAMELLLAQLILVLETESCAGFSADKLGRWMQLCSDRMEQTGSVPQDTVAALRGICGRVTS